MTNTASHASNATADVDAYVAALFEALGPRDPLDVLRGTPDALRRGIVGMTPQQLSQPEASGKWSARQMLQHLSDSELVGAFRFRMVLAHDRPAIPGYDQNLWIERLHHDDEDVEAALSDFSGLRRANLRLVDRTTPIERQRVGIHSERGEESLAYMLRLYAGHDIVHLRQLARIRRAVGAGDLSG